jgi:hypothetical protein
MIFDALQEIQVVRPPESGRHVKHVFATEPERAFFGEGALTAPGAAEDQSMDRYSASPSMSRNVSTSHPFSFAPFTATRKNPSPSP